MTARCRRVVKKFITIVAVAAVVELGVGACGGGSGSNARESTLDPRERAPTQLITPIDPAYQGAHITRTGTTNTYSLTGSAHVSAPATNREPNAGNLRGAWWPAGQAETTDSESCATWVSQNGNIVQQGAALRVVQPPGAESAKAVTVVKNVLGWRWYFDVFVWEGGNATGIQGFDLSSTFIRGGRLAPLPWHLCARATGSQVTFIAWPDPDPKPAWGDPARGGTVTLPSGWVYPGHTGWYIGHLNPGDDAWFSDLQTG
jgi:hypothetical protein